MAKLEMYKKHYYECGDKFFFDMQKIGEIYYNDNAIDEREFDELETNEKMVYINGGIDFIIKAVNKKKKSSKKYYFIGGVFLLLGFFLFFS